MIETKVLITVVVLLSLTNLYTVYLALKAGSKLEAQRVVEFYRGFYTAKLFNQPGRFNHCRLLTHLALADQVHAINPPGWRWPLPRAYRTKSCRRGK